jgi:hypothetical protein
MFIKFINITNNIACEHIEVQEKIDISLHTIIAHIYSADITFITKLLTSLIIICISLWRFL